MQVELRHREPAPIRLDRARLACRTACGPDGATNVVGTRYGGWGNRKSGLSLNHVIGCPLDCGYCVRHLFDNFAMKVPRALMSDEQAVELLVGHRFFQPHLTPVQVFTDERIEPIDSTIAAVSLNTAFTHAGNYRVVLYWRPIVPGLNDSDDHLRQALRLSSRAHATVFTGLFHKNQIRDYYRAHGLPEPYRHGARRKIFPEALERRILSAGAARQGGLPLFRKTSCAVSFTECSTASASRCTT